MSVFLNLNTLGYDTMGTTMTLPRGGDRRHAVLDAVRLGDEVITLDRDTLQLRSTVDREAYDDRRQRDENEIAVRAVDMTPRERCRPVTRDRVRTILWEHQPEALLSEDRFRIDAWLIELNDGAAAAIKACACR